MKIFLIGWFGAGNMGDEAILLSELLFLRENIKEAEFYILSFDTKRTKRLTSNMPEVKKILRMGVKQDVVRSDICGILKAFREVDLVVVGGGGIFQDIYNHYPIPFFTLMALLAKLNKKLLLLYCVGIGPINTFIGKKLCKLTVNSSDIVSVRDSESRDLLKDLGVTKKVYLSADPVFLLEPEWNEQVDKAIKTHNLDKSEPTIGVCVQDLLFWDNENRRILADILDTLIIERGVKVVFLPFGAYRDVWFTKKKSDTVDTAASKKLSELMKEESSILTDELLPQELLAVIEKMDIIVSMRLHGLIMGLNAGVPVIALTYTEESKIRNLMKRFDQEDRLFEVCSLDKQRLSKKMNCLLYDKDNVKKHLLQSVSTLRTEIKMCNKSVFKTVTDWGAISDYKETDVNQRKNAKEGEVNFV